MRRVWIEKTGPPDVLTLRQEPDVSPGPGELRIRVSYAGVNFAEVMARLGLYPDAPPLPFVPGSEVAGTVRSAPEGSELKEGDRVAAFPMLGGFAEVAVSPEFLTFPLPDALDYAQGAGLILNYHTAWFSLVIRGRLKAGESVLKAGSSPRLQEWMTVATETSMPAASVFSTAPITLR